MILAVVVLILGTVSFFTPLFSNAGLFFLTRLPIPTVVTEAGFQTKATPTELSEKSDSYSQTPTAYVVLGGGLTTNDSDAIIINEFTQSRLKTVLQHYQDEPLPIVLSGVEAPWMKERLAERGIEEVVTENASMNTCENARFTAKRLAVDHVYLVTDAYHMSRAQRQFALNGIATTPLIAPLPSAAAWNDIAANYRHSMRTLYEIGAYMRDILIPQQDCRKADEVPMSTLKRSRKTDSTKTF